MYLYVIHLMTICLSFDDHMSKFYLDYFIYLYFFSSNPNFIYRFIFLL